MGTEEKKMIQYSYEFMFKDGKKYQFILNLSCPDMKQIRKEIKIEEMPFWSKIDFHRCPNCTLDEKTHKICPAMECLHTILETFKDILSVEEVEVTATMQERTTIRKLPIQKALSSLIGIYFATSDCPILSKFSPLARFHLPFATTEETVYRATANYLLAQYFVYKEGKKPDWDLEGLKKFYKDVEIVNKAISKRINSISKQDANINALVTLDVFAKSFGDLFEIFLDKIKPLFARYMDDDLSR